MLINNTITLLSNLKIHNVGKEIERKFLVKNENYRINAKRAFIHQGFLNNDKKRVVRVRIEDSRGTLTIKGLPIGNERAEFEYDIPLIEAEQLLDELCMQPTIKKYRFRVMYKGFTWEVDEFLEENEGLVVAEVEIPKTDTILELPKWVAKEVSNDPKYYNSNLIEKPFNTWETN
jgi:adenylate cyclase